jgi:C4-dicarboxylate-specific signal transduction histidine kinase
LQDSKAATATDEHQQELAAVKERVQQMTNRMGQMEQKVRNKTVAGHTHC